MKLDWEVIHTTTNGDVRWSTERAKIEGGWLISQALAINNNPAIAVTFITDPEHKWIIDKDV